MSVVIRQIASEVNPIFVYQNNNLVDICVSREDCDKWKGEKVFITTDVYKMPSDKYFYKKSIIEENLLKNKDNINHTYIGNVHCEADIIDIKNRRKIRSNNPHKFEYIIKVNVPIGMDYQEITFSCKSSSVWECIKIFTNGYKIKPSTTEFFLQRITDIEKIDLNTGEKTKIIPLNRHNLLLNSLKTNYSIYKELRSIRGRFYGVFVRQEKAGFRDTYVLLKDIKLCDTDKIMSDYLNIGITRDLKKLGQLQEGDLVYFDALIKPYIDTPKVYYKISYPHKYNLNRKTVN